jgi:hypothetical protein
VGLSCRRQVSDVLRSSAERASACPAMSAAKEPA